MLNVNRAIVYENLVDDQPVRTVEELINIFKGLNTDFIFRAFFRWKPISDEQFIRLKDITGHIRTQLPYTIIVGGIPAQRILFNDVNDITKTVITKTQAYEMALDPAKWGINFPSKEELQNNQSKYFGVSGIGSYFPDITNSKFQQMALSWVEKQIEAGINGIWIDLLYSQVRYFKNLTNDQNHPAVKESLKGTEILINKIRELHGGILYVGSWQPPRWQSSNPLDFITLTVSSCETLCGKIDINKWSYEKSEINRKFGDIPIFVFIDWGGILGPMQTFTQLTTDYIKRKEHEINVLRTFTQTFKDLGIKFIYPVHGGDLIGTIKILSYGKYGRYDSLAPEFGTFSTIKNLIKI